MEKYQMVIIDLLKASINKTNIGFNKENDIEWNEIINEAKQHKISSLIYSAIDKSSLKYIDNNIVTEWKKDILKDSVIQIRHINNISKLVNNLNKQGIEIILLKGLVLRNFYPRPEYRTMCDADILVKPKDYLNVKNYLIKNCYQCIGNNHPVHQCFMYSNQPHIEVHWKLINQNYFNRDISEFDENIWRKSIKFNICEVNCRTLCDEDFLIHMCLHMVVHAKYKGFGLRQLYDVAMFVKNKNIDWASFYSRISFYGVSKFIKGLFELLHQIFDINIPKDSLGDKYISKQDIELLLANVLASGAHGKKEEINGFDALCQCETNEKYTDSNVKRIVKLFFPTRAKLSDRYRYAKGNVLLLPIAWIHHAMTGIFIKKYGIFRMFKYGKESLDILNRRKEVIKTFDL